MTIGFARGWLCGAVRNKKPPARAGGFVQFANKVLIALP
jgi:hypothetical protein